MAQLRDMGAEFVTYERRKYPKLPDERYEHSLEITLPSRPKQPLVVRYVELDEKNLGSERGRVRRIYLLTEDGEKFNLLAISTLPPEILIRKQLARWSVQENQLKHEVERWGINQLDGRTVEPYPPDAIIPNPDRRRIEHKLRLACIGEGEALRRLFGSVALDAEDPRRERFERDRALTVERQKELGALRAKVPPRAPLEQTSLAGKLSRHKQMYKRVLDTIRVALANAESELAVRLAIHLERPREAKKITYQLVLCTGHCDSTAARYRRRADAFGLATRTNGIHILPAPDQSPSALPAGRSAGQATTAFSTQERLRSLTNAVRTVGKRRDKPAERKE